MGGEPFVYLVICADCGWRHPRDLWTLRSGERNREKHKRETGHDRCEVWAA